MTDELEKLAPEVREAIGLMDRVPTRAWAIVRTELARLAGDLNEASLGRDTYLAKYEAMRERAEQAEAELAALKARILPGAAKVEIADTDDPDGNPYGWVGGTLLSHNLIGKRVRLLVVED